MNVCSWYNKTSAYCRRTTSRRITRTTKQRVQSQSHLRGDGGGECCAIARHTRVCRPLLPLAIRVTGAASGEAAFSMLAATCFLLLLHAVESAKILLYNPLLAQSHVTFMSSIGRVLIEEGHQVVSSRFLLGALFTNRKVSQYVFVMAVISDSSCPFRGSRRPFRLFQLHSLQSCRIPKRSDRRCLESLHGIGRRLD